MTDPTGVTPMEGCRVTEEIHGASPHIPDYSLLPGDLLVRDGDTWTKEAPGICVGGFVLSAEQEQTLQPVRFTCIGLTYQIQEAHHG